MRARRLRLFCGCGDSLVAEIAPPESMQRVMRAWVLVHHGAGHPVVDAQTCRMVRKMLEKTQLNAKEKPYGRAEPGAENSR